MRNIKTVDMDSAALRNVFICQLSLLYAAKTHLTSSLPALVEQAAFVNLKNALKEDLEDSSNQMLRLQEILVLMNEKPMTENCLGMNAIIKEAYESVRFLDGKNYESDMSIIFYMGVIEHLQLGAGRMLNLIAKSKGFKRYSVLVEQTLDMCVDNTNLFQLIAKEYIS
jgi:ferritin-like metal-binding protein YciE